MRDQVFMAAEHVFFLLVIYLFLALLRHAL